jgi:hypothetical protein
MFIDELVKARSSSKWSYRQLLRSCDFFRHFDHRRGPTNLFQGIQVGSQVLRYLLEVSGAAHARDFRAECLGDLHRKGPDASRRAVDQKSGAGPTLPTSRMAIRAVRPDMTERPSCDQWIMSFP